MTAVKQTIIDSTDANNVYYGSADLGRATSSANWSIYRKNTTGSVVTNAYPIGLAKSPSEKEVFTWDDRAVYNYSLTDDSTAPTLASVTETSVTTLNVVLSEVALASTITKANAGGFVVYETGTPATIYVVSAIAPGADDKHIILTVADMTASAIPGVTVTYVAGGNGTVSDIGGILLATDAIGVATGAF